ncbi:MAG: cupredoxin domain-containing protein [Pseudolabrys sp.]
MMRRLPSTFIIIVVAGLLCSVASPGYAQNPRYIVSQKGRQFHPQELTIKRGQTIQIVNDDGDLRHHAYIKSPTFNFDSGDQEPGSKTNITFPVQGTFDIRCAIHPKMLLVVHVK